MYLKSLLDRGAGVGVYSRDYLSPLFRALLIGNLEAADLIARSCSRVVLEELLGLHSASKFTMMGRIVSGWDLIPR
jgi:hypothetical protein